MTGSDPGETAKETIILVHGTFAAPRVGGPSQWYQPRSEFCRDLNARLKKLGSPARCWAHLTDDSSCFFWSGRNDWAARTAAAADLARLMYTLIKDGWRVHVVAHSHGGNVLLEALDIGAEGFAQAHDYEDGYLVLMGTPIMELRELAKSGCRSGTCCGKSCSRSRSFSSVSGSHGPRCRSASCTGSATPLHAVSAWQALPL
jgi:hypothetical protein